MTYILKRFWKPKIKVHDLDFDGLEMVCYRLTNVLTSTSKDHMTVKINVEHFKFWAWMGQIVSASDGNPIEYFSSEEFQLKELFYHTIRCALVSGEQRDINILTLDQYEMASGSLRSVSYLSFPLLEGMLRKVCNNYVDYSGNVIQEFTINYSPDKSKTYKIGDNCRSIKNMLYLYQSKIIDDSTKLDCLLQDVHKLSSNGDHAFQTIYNWRNSSLHGNRKAFVNIGGIVLNISLFILLDSIKNKYGTYQERALRSAEIREKENPKYSLLFYKPNSVYKFNITLGQRKEI